LFIHNPIKKHSDGKKYLSRTRKYKDNNNVKNKLIDLNKYWNLYKSKTNEIQYDKIKKLYKEGKSYGNIAKILNIGLGTVRYQLVPGEKEKIRLRIKNNKKIERGSK
jgi:DNA invertase Pin-like site-specific DNA recombinase